MLLGARNPSRNARLDTERNRVYATFGLDPALITYPGRRSEWTSDHELVAPLASRSPTVRLTGIVGSRRGGEDRYLQPRLAEHIGDKMSGMRSGRRGRQRDVVGRRHGPRERRTGPAGRARETDSECHGFVRQAAVTPRRSIKHASAFRRAELACNRALFIDRAQPMTS
jgi:hypothetical protein